MIAGKQNERLMPQMEIKWVRKFGQQRPTG
jgi:hypothetical protein